MAQVTPEQELAQRNRLPTLMEVLGRRTLAPVDLFSFYIYMRDQQRSVDYLDFWLDVSQHMSLCRHYVRELRRSMLLETPEVDKITSKRSSQHMDGLDLGETVSHHSSGEKQSNDQRVSAMLRSDSGHMHNRSDGSRRNDYSPANSLTSRLSQGFRPSTGDQNKPNSDKPSEGPPRPSFMSTGEPQTDSGNSPGHSVARQDLKTSAEKILYTFVLPGSEREIVLPEVLVNRIIRAIEEDGRDDPEVFDDAKDYVFQAMERDAFPGFLQAKAFGNLVPLSVLLRLVIGLVSLTGGLWAGYYLILTDAKRSTRCWVILPYTIGCYCLVAYQYKLDIIAAYAGASEYTFMNWSKVREPFVKKLLMTRASVASLVFVLVTVALCVLFIFVPGTKFG